MNVKRERVRRRVAAEGGGQCGCVCGGEIAVRIVVDCGGVVCCICLVKSYYGGGVQSTMVKSRIMTGSG